MPSTRRLNALDMPPQKIISKGMPSIDLAGVQRRAKQRMSAEALYRFSSMFIFFFMLLEFMFWMNVVVDGPFSLILAIAERNFVRHLYTMLVVMTIALKEPNPRRYGERMMIHDDIFINLGL
ncbi:hypothetical protein ACJX0J_029272, partial [Zea mays]